MAHNKEHFQRSLQLLSHSIALTMRLGETVEVNNDRVAALRNRLRKAQAELVAAHERRRLLNRQLAVRRADRAFLALIEYLTAILAELSRNP